jgi:hypothetical protein
MSEPVIPSLTAPQETAITSLLAGQSATEAAAAAGVNRSTLWRWTKDPMFEAALNRRKREIFEQAHSRLAQIAQDALGIIQAAVAGGDAPTALAVLKGVGLLTGQHPPIGTDNPKELELVAALRLT